MELMKVCNLLEDVTLLKNGEFTYLGLLVSRCNEKLLSFIEDEKYINTLEEDITCLITTRELGEKLKNRYGVIISQNPRMDYFKLHNKLSEDKCYLREEFDTVIGENCNINRLASISTKNVKIGNNVIVEEFAIIRENTVIGDNSIIRAGAILGGEGFEYKRADGIIIDVKHCGGVIIDKNVEIQYNTCIDRAVYTWDNTIIGEYSKLDNQIHIGHGGKIGKRCLIAAGAVYGGRTVLGDDSWVGIGVNISNGLILGRKVSINLGAVVTRNVDDGQSVSGNFAIDHGKFINFIKTIR